MNKEWRFISINILLIIVASIVFCLTSCMPAPQYTPAKKPAPAGSDTISESPQEEDLTNFFPYKPGNTWKYEGKGMENTTFIQTVVNRSGNKYQLTIENGATIVANVIEVNKDSVVNTYRQEDAYDYANLMTQPSNINIIMLMTPLREGTFWISEENHYEIIDTDRDIEVPAGRFEDCIVVKKTYKDQRDSMLFYYKRDIGLVQSEFISGKGDKIITRLENYSFR